MDYYGFTSKEAQRMSGSGSPDSVNVAGASRLDVARVQADFPILEREVNGHRLVYLDSANTSQKPRQVLAVLREHYERHNGNVSRSVHTLVVLCHFCGVVRWSYVDVVRVDQLHGQLLEFTEDVFASLTRSGWLERCGSYLRGLLLDGSRKSVQPMASRLPGVDDQALNHFVTNSPWPVEPVQQRLARRMSEAITPAAWAIDDTGFLKCGNASVGVWPQYTGTAGKIANCQIAVSVNMVTDTASCPVNWRLFLPEAWDPASEHARPDTTKRRDRTGIPEGVGHREKMADWGLRPPLVVADAGYGDSGEFRLGLAERDLSYVVQTASTLTLTAYREDDTPTTLSLPRPRTDFHVALPRQSPSVQRELILATGQRQARTVTWRDGSRHRAGNPVKMRSRFMFLRVRPAGRVIRSAHLNTELPVLWLIAEWPTGQPQPVKYWLANLPADSPHRTLVRWAKLRWRIEHDYRELKAGLGLDHYEGRTWQGWHHHVTLVSAAHAFCTLQRLDPKTPAPE